MNKMKVVSIVGARPQFIKAAVVSQAFKKIESIEEIIIHTGQHFDVNMSDIFFKEMGIPYWNYNLNINKLSNGAMTGRMLEKIEDILFIEQPDFVLVYGDTNSTLAGALAAKKNHIKVAHVEAGLRSFNMRMPEEINRVVTDRISDILFCPTQKAIDNLLNEGFDKLGFQLILCGDVMQDAALHFSHLAKKPKEQIPDLFVLATVHRSENTDSKENLFEIFAALEKLAETIPIVFPLHPRTNAKLKEYGYNFKNTKILLIKPSTYFETIYLLKNCQLVMTDSGGLQKEAYFFQKNCITLRKETEWTELIESGTNVLAGTSFEKIIDTFNQMNGKVSNFSTQLYGSGHAGDTVANELCKFFMGINKT